MKKFVLYTVLVFTMFLLVGCDVSNIEVAASGYEDSVVLGESINAYLDDSTSDEAVKAALESYFMFFSSEFDYTEDSLTVTIYNTSGLYVSDRGSSDNFIIALNFFSSAALSEEVYAAFEFAAIQMIHEISQLANETVNVSLSGYFGNSSVSFSGIDNGKSSENTLLRNVSIVDQTQTTVDLYTDFIENYMGNEEGYAFDVTVLNVAASDASFYLTIDHVNSEFKFQLGNNTDYSLTDFQTLLEGLLPGYSFVEWNTEYVSEKA
ncbi:MAG: hypothetical protein JEZ05_09875 [Tenericutes bacterium]|nr:hypothetical protein [Mycoplasmatota bacterium]